ncbi:nucleolar protein 11 [Eleutherodactylus coqui]|uniref:nucleolar protein 11 n=1 Tax=Eleutherodactylus coqui TaxID=57060 RepID=UPI003462E062
MAALCEAFTLCSLLYSDDAKRQQQEGLQGVEGAGERDSVLVTDGGRTVTLYKVSDRRPLGSWAVRQGQRITSPAVYNHRSGEYVLVHDEKVLRVWKDDDVNFDKVFKATLSTDVCRVHSLPDAEPFILFRGGAVRYLDAMLADPQQEIETVVTEDEKIVWSKAFMDDEQPMLIFITEKHPDWFVYTRHPAFSTCERWRLPPAADCSKVLDFSAVIKNKMVSMVLLYSSGHVCQSEILLASSEQNVEAELLVSPLLQLPEPADTGALIILDDSYIATLTPSPARKKDCLCIWNTSFQTLQDCKEFAQKTWTQLWTYDSKLFIPHANSLLVLRYACQQSCLASALGKGKETQKSEAVSIMNWGELIGSPKQSEPTPAKNPHSVKETPSSSEMSFPLEILPDIQMAPESQIPSLVQRASMSRDLVHLQVAISSIAQGLITRCKKEPKFYPQSSFIKLLESGTLSHSLCPDLITLCVEKQDVQLLQLCLEQFVDLPEDMLCLCLKTFLSVGEAILSKASLNTKSAASYIEEDERRKKAMKMETTRPVQNGFSHPIVDNCGVQVLNKRRIHKTGGRFSPVTIRRAVLLNSVLTCPFSETFLLPHLKDLTSDQAILFLDYLFYLYKKCNDNFVLSLPGQERLSVMQVLDWLNIILDANFTVLVLTPEAKNLVRSLQKYMKSQMSFFSELNKVEGSLAEIPKFRKPTQSCNRYSIEVLTLY